MNGKCELCGIKCNLTKHHLIPQLKCKNKYKDIKEDSNNLLWICDSCHGTIHATFSENELRDLYNTKEKLLSTYEIKKYVDWKMKHPNFNGHSKMNNRRK
jgi:hypothetical protein